MEENKLFPKIGKQNLKTRVYELLLDMIIDGKLKVGDMLPAERVLSEELGVSRTVLREAIKSLETRGVLTVTHGKGIVVNPVTGTEISHAFMLYLRRKQQQIPLMDLLEFRSIVEPQVAKLAASKITEEELEKLEDIIERMKAAIDNVDQFNKVDLEYHIELAKITRNIFLITVMEELIIPIRESIFATGGIHVKKVFEEHYEVFKCIKAKKPEEASRAMVKSLKHSRKILERHSN
jgi:DNA-binding FadR family transcriptional regulator